MNKKKGVIALACLVVLITGIILVNASDEMIVEANFIGYDSEAVQISVPDHIFLGNITMNEPFYDTAKGEVYIDNIGREDVIVTPELVSDPEGIFQYISFRKSKGSSNETLNEFHKIGDWSINVDKRDSEDFYMSIDLTDFTEILESEEITLSSTIRFVAMSTE